MLTHEVEKGPKGQSGFTLIELLIVIAIIAILAAIAIPMFLRYKQGAYLASVRSDVKNTATAVEAFSATYGDYPTSTKTCGSTTSTTTQQCGLMDASNTSTNALNLSVGNVINITYETCSSTTGGTPTTTTTNPDGYLISGYSGNISSGPGSSSTDVVSYDSCTGAYVGF